MSTRLAIIGVGKWGSNIVRTLSGSGLLSLAAAVTSKSKRELQEIAPFEGVIFEDYKDLISLQGQLDGVIISTPPAGRERIIDFFLDAGVPVFSEKPLTLDTHETARLVEKSRRRGVPLVQDFIHLYSWAYIAIWQQLPATGRIEIESIGGNVGPYRDYSPVYDYGPHDFSMALQIFRCRPRLLAAEVLDRESDLRFSTRVELDFGGRGTVSMKFGNTFTKKQRIFRCRAGGDEWTYDDTAADKLVKNGRPHHPDGGYGDYSPLELALQCFAGHHSLYSRDVNWWLSESVAELTEEIAERVG